MNVTRVPQIGRAWKHNPFLRRLVFIYLAIWLIAAIAPHDRGDWFLENLIVFGAAALLVATHHRFMFSNLSWLLIACFLALHAVGAHYTYSLTPAGFWLQDALGLQRNPYDRSVHFAFGLLLTYPLRELILRRLHVHGSWSYVLPLLVALALSSGYEIVESWTARVVDPSLGTAFLGAQGDEWDAQKDMGLAIAGSALCLTVTALFRVWRGAEPWHLLAPND
jgi:putative membrane protein